MGGNNPGKKDGDGFISRLSPDGKILDLHWIGKLNDPRGMGIVGGYLYATDITEILKIDIAGKKVIARYPVKGAKFLNDLDVDSQGTVYFSDMGADKVYALENGKIKLLSDSKELKSPNGIYFDNGRVLIGCSGYMLAMNPVNGRLTRFIENTGGIDGLEKYDTNRYIITDWSGATHLVQPGKEKILLLDTRAKKINAADLDFIPQKKMMLIPTFSDNRVMAYKISEGK
jgi:outer membrane protein assembly factor BamB